MGLLGAKRPRTCCPVPNNCFMDTGLMTPVVTALWPSVLPRFRWRLPHFRIPSGGGRWEGVRAAQKPTISPAALTSPGVSSRPLLHKTRADRRQEHRGDRWPWSCRWCNHLPFNSGMEVLPLLPAKAHRSGVWTPDEAPRLREDTSLVSPHPPPPGQTPITSLMFKCRPLLPLAGVAAPTMGSGPAAQGPRPSCGPVTQLVCEMGVGTTALPLGCFLPWPMSEHLPRSGGQFSGSDPALFCCRYCFSF